MESPYIDRQGRLLPFDFAAAPVKDLAIVLVHRDDPGLIERQVDEIKRMAIPSWSMDIHVVDMGSDPDGRSPHATVVHGDPGFRGRCFGQNIGLRHAARTAGYRYYGVLGGTGLSGVGSRALERMLRVMEEHPEVGVLDLNGAGNADPKGEERTWERVAVCGDDNLLVRAECLKDCGFLDPGFRHGTGAGLEYAHRLRRSGIWVAARCIPGFLPDPSPSLPGTREDPEALRLARRFAAHYFIEHFGRNWDAEFQAELPGDIGGGEAFRLCRAQWESAFTEDERIAMRPLPEPEDLPGRIAALNPWYYPLVIGGIPVTPGLGCPVSAEDLAGRAEYMRKLWIDELAERYPVRGKSVLDIACNCGYFSGLYARMGAERFLGVEGRLDYVNQGRLYWGEEHFLPEGRWEFLHGNVCAPDIHEQIRNRGPHDFTLCAGILYHIPDYEDLLAFLASVTREAMLVDTRLEPEEAYVQEPGGWKFDAIAETSLKKVPTLAKLQRILADQGFRIETLSIPDPIPAGLAGKDDYGAGNRVALLALR